MSRRIALLVVLTALIGLRPVSAFQTSAPPAGQGAAPAVDAALQKQFVSASPEARATLLAAHPEILEKPFLQGLSTTGLGFRDRNEFDTAEQWFNAVLWVGRNGKMPRYEGIALINLGTVAGMRGNLTEARDTFERASAIGTSTGDLETVQSAMGNLGILRRKVGDLDGAFDLQTRALELARQLDKKDAIARTLNNLGSVLRDQGNSARALERYFESLNIREQMSPDATDLAGILTNIGNIYVDTTDYAVAIDYYLRAVAVIEATGSKLANTNVYNNLGRAYASIGEFAKAQQCLDTAQAQAEKARDAPRFTATLFLKGVIERLQGHLKEAEAFQRQALAIREQTSLAVGIVESLTEMAHLLYLTGRYAEGLPYAERALAAATDSKLLNQKWIAQLINGHLHARLGHNEQARVFYDQAIAAVELLRQLTPGGERARQHYLAERMGPYYGMAALNATEGRPLDALLVLDQARARTLIDILASGRQPVQTLTPQQRQQEHDVTQAMLNASTQFDTETQKPHPDPKRLADLDKAQERARLARDAFMGTLYAGQPSLRLAHGDTPLATREQLADLLTPGTAIVTFVLDAPKAWTYVLTPGPNGPVVTAQELTAGSKAITELTTQFSQQIASRDLAFSANARALYDALLGQADSLLTGVNQLIIVPDGPLWQVPFQALQTPRGTFLIDERAVSYSPSIAALSALELRRRSRPAQPTYLVAFGDPAGIEGIVAAPTGAATRAGIARLPEAAREVRSLGELYGANRSAVLVANQASETALRERASKASVLHIATHGVFDDGNPMYSHLLLAPGTGPNSTAVTDHLSDGRLEAWEVLDLGINADLVVLSACKTARGTSWGEGIIGLSWSLFAAGASTAVVSQWEVDSASTTSLMIAFHRARLRTGTPTTAAEALRQAAIGLMKNPAYRHPFYWAGFISVGAK